MIGSSHPVDLSMKHELGIQGGILLKKATHDTKLIAAPEGNRRFGRRIDKQPLHDRLSL